MSTVAMFGWVEGLRPGSQFVLQDRQGVGLAVGVDDGRRGRGTRNRLGGQRFRGDRRRLRQPGPGREERIRGQVRGRGGERRDGRSAAGRANTSSG